MCTADGSVFDILYVIQIWVLLAFALHVICCLFFEIFIRFACVCFID